MPVRDIETPMHNPSHHAALLWAVASNPGNQTPGNPGHTLCPVRASVAFQQQITLVCEFLRIFKQVAFA
jgi:hypothetical protein